MSESDSTIPDGFRQIADFPRYAISEDGIVLSICITGKGAYRSLPWNKARRLASPMDSHGYKRVELYGRGRKRVFVHALVLESFVGPCPNGMECRHLDGDKTNNHVTNLTWGTRSENVHDTLLHGTSNHGERSGSAKLTNDDVLQIRQRAADGELHRVIAEDFPVARNTITRIVNRLRWKNV